MTTPERWADQARYDIDTAKAMLEAKPFPYVLFMRQQAIEKALKAIVIQVTGKMAPRIHSLVKLGELAQLKLSAEQEKFYAELVSYYIGSRYPEDLLAMSKRVSHQKAKEALDKSEEEIQWLLSLLK
ncbi:MAG: HEPN domain-containing protein [Nitrospinae bacterium]|nr:HEPN domain-containing protein [Nitrospinota bacterium]